MQIFTSVVAVNGKGCLFGGRRWGAAGMASGGEGQGHSQSQLVPVSSAMDPP